MKMNPQKKLADELDRLVEIDADADEDTAKLSMLAVQNARDFVKFYCSPFIPQNMWVVKTAPGGVLIGLLVGRAECGIEFTPEGCVSADLGLFTPDEEGYGVACRYFIDAIGKLK